METGRMPGGQRLGTPRGEGGGGEELGLALVGRIDGRGEHFLEDEEIDVGFLGGVRPTIVLISHKNSDGRDRMNILFTVDGFAVLRRSRPLVSTAGPGNDDVALKAFSNVADGLGWVVGVGEVFVTAALDRSVV